MSAETWPFGRVTGLEEKGDRLNFEIFSRTAAPVYSFTPGMADVRPMRGTVGFSPIFWVFSLCRGTLAIVAWNDGRGVGRGGVKREPATFFCSLPPPLFPPPPGAPYAPLFQTHKRGPVARYLICSLHAFRWLSEFATTFLSCCLLSRSVVGRSMADDGPWWS